MIAVGEDGAIQERSVFWLRLASGFVSGAYWGGLLGAAMLLVAVFYPNPNHDRIGDALWYVAFKPFVGLYVAGFVVGLLRKPQAPRLWAVYLASAVLWIMTRSFLGDVEFVSYEVGCLVFSCFTIVCGHVLKGRLEPVRRALDVPDSSATIAK